MEYWRTTFDGSIAELIFTEVNGTGSAIAYDATVAEYGKGSAKLTMGTTVGAYVRVTRSMGISPVGRLAVQAGIRPYLAGGPYQFSLDMYLTAFDPNGFSVYHLFLNQNTVDMRLFYYDQVGALQQLVVLPQLNDPDMFHQIRLEVNNQDPENPVYDRAVFNGTPFPIVDANGVYQAAARSSSSAVQPRVYHRIIVNRTAETVARVLHLGSWVFEKEVGLG